MLLTAPKLHEVLTTELLGRLYPKDDAKQSAHRLLQLLSVAGRWIGTVHSGSSNSRLHRGQCQPSTSPV
jgi:hypothetical protein